MKKLDNFIVRVERKRNPNNIAAQMANVQEALLGMIETLPPDNKNLNKLCKEFTKLKGLMYGFDNGDSDNKEL